MSRPITKATIRAMTIPFRRAKPSEGSAGFRFNRSLRVVADFDRYPHPGMDTALEVVRPGREMSARPGCDKSELILRDEEVGGIRRHGAQAAVRTDERTFRRRDRVVRE